MTPTPPTEPALDLDIQRDLSGETVCGFRVAAYRETHPEHGAKYGHRYSEHWSTPSANPAVTVERLFTEAQLRAALSRLPEGGGESSASAESMCDGALPIASEPPLSAGLSEPPNSYPSGRDQ